MVLAGSVWTPATFPTRLRALRYGEASKMHLPDRDLPSRREMPSFPVVPSRPTFAHSATVGRREVLSRQLVDPRDGVRPLGTSCSGSDP